MERTVHVTPMGWEHDRVVNPIVDARAHKAYLLARLDHEDARHFLGRAKGTLEAQEIEVVEVEVDPDREFESTILHVARLIHKESQEGNRVFVNMSAGGKIAAVAASLAAMYHQASLGGIYYTQPDDYLVGVETGEGTGTLKFEDHGLTAGYAGTQGLPALELKKPDEAGIRTLVGIYHEGALTLDGILGVLHDARLGLYESPEIQEILDAKFKSQVHQLRNKWVQKLRRSVINELIDLNLVTKRRRGVGDKLHFDLTKDGEYYALASGLVDELREAD